jgi:anti-sigma-K factor RskA
LVFAVQRNSQVTLLNTQLAQRDSILAARTVTLAQRDSALNTMLEAGRNLVLVNLVTAPDSGPSMQLFWDVKQKRGVIHAANLKPAEAGRIYQLWFIKDGKPVPSRIFNTASDNHSLEWGIEMPTSTAGVTAVAITNEPAGGSQQPTTTPFLVGEIPKALQ